jgi:hypothetical protein
MMEADYANVSFQDVVQLSSSQIGPHQHHLGGLLK